MSSSSGGKQAISSTGLSTSSDLVLRCFAPQIISEAYRRCEAPLGDFRDRLGWSLGFVDILQRYFVAVLANEHAGLGLPPCNEFKKLVNKLKTPSLGDWGKAAEALSQELLEAPEKLVVPELPALLIEGGGTGKGARSEFLQHLVDLIDIRNTQVCHADGTIIPDEGTARRLYSEIEGPLRTICLSLRFLRDYPVFYLDSKKTNLDDTIELRVFRFVGRDATMLTLQSEEDARLAEKSAFILSREGTRLNLTPFVTVARNAGNGAWEMRLLNNFDESAKTFEYTALLGGEKTALDFEAVGPLNSPDALKAIPHTIARKDGTVPEPLIERFIGPCAGEAIPNFDQYRIEHRLGVGSASTVYLAREILKGRPPSAPIALKLLKPLVVEDPVQRVRLESESKLLAQLQHQGIVGGLHYGECPRNGPYLVMEYIKGEDLESLVSRRPLTVQKAAEICSAVLEALQFAHEKEVVHRDIKPSNVLIDTSGAVKLIDFGIALTEQFARVTKTLEAVGTTGFAAPEQLMGQVDIDRRADIFGVGRMFEYLITQKVLPLGEAKGLPDGAHAVIRKATQRRREDRYQTAEEMRLAIQERLQGGWAGAPVERQSRLNDSYDLTNQEGEVEGINLFGGREVETEDYVSIAVCKKGSEPGKMLRTLIHESAKDVRRSIDYRGLQSTQDGILFLVYGGNALDGFRRLQGREIGEKAPEHKEKTTLVDRSLYEGWPEQRRRLVEVFVDRLETCCEEFNESSPAEQLSTLILPFAAQMEVFLLMLLRVADGVEPLKPKLGGLMQWYGICQRATLGKIIGEYERFELLNAERGFPLTMGLRLSGMETEPAHLHTRVLRFLKELTRLRNFLAHAIDPQTDETLMERFREDVQVGCSCLLNLCIYCLEQRADDTLAPYFISEGGAEGGVEFLLPRFKRDGYVDLATLEPTNRPMPASLAEFIQAEDVGFRASSDEASVATQKPAAFASLERAVLERLSDSRVFSSISMSPRKSRFGRHLEADMVAYVDTADGEMPFAVVEVKSQIALNKRLHQTEMLVFRLSHTFETPAACIATDEGNYWFRVDRKKGLIEIDEEELQRLLLDIKEGKEP